jgi:hypothetical protein
MPPQQSNAPQDVQTPEGGTVRVIAPNGRAGTIPKANLQRALAKGYKQAAAEMQQVSAQTGGGAGASSGQLARQPTKPEPPGFWQSLGEAYGGPVSFKEMGHGIAYLFQHPADTLQMFGQGIGDAQKATFLKGADAWANRRYTDAFAYFMYSGIPLLGPQMAGAGEQFARKEYAGGAGTMVGLASQLFAGSPEARANVVSGLEEVGRRVAKPRAIIRGEEFPMTKGEAAPIEGVRGKVEHAMSQSFVGKPLQKLANRQQSMARDLITKIAGEQSGYYGNPDEVVGNVQQAAKVMRTDAGTQYEHTFNTIDEQHRAGVMHEDSTRFRDLQREISDLRTKQRSAFMSGNSAGGTLNSYYDLSQEITEKQQQLDRLFQNTGNDALLDQYNSARKQYAQARAMEDFHVVLDKVIKGLSPSQQRMPGASLQPRAPFIPGEQLVEKLKDLNDQLPRAVGANNAKAIMQVAEILKRSQSTSRMGNYAHWAATYGPAVYALEKAWGGDIAAGMQRAAGMYGGMWVAAKLMSSPPMRRMLFNFLQSSIGSPQESFWRARVLAAAAAGSAEVAKGARQPAAPQQPKIPGVHE